MKGRAPVVFEGDFFDEDVERAGEAGKAAARGAREEFEGDGVALRGDKDLLEHEGLEPPAIDARSACRLLGLS